MKHLLRFLAFGLLWLGQSTYVFGQTTPTADTLAGHAQLVHLISASLCTQLTNDHTTNLNKLSEAEVMTYAQGLFVGAMQRDSVRLLALMTAAAARGEQPTQVGQQLGHDAMLELTANCPAARPLALRLGQTQQGQKALAAQVPKLDPAEQKVLQPVAAALCTELSARNAQADFSQLTPASRKQVFRTAMQKALKPHSATLMRYYGSANLDAKLRSGELDGKIGSLMPSQAGCGQYLLLIGADNLTEKDKP